MWLAAIIVIIIIIFIYIIATINTSTQTAYLVGIWTGDDAFCQDAGIDSMMMLIGDEDADGRHTGYLIIASGGNMICNQAFVLQLSPGWAGPFISTYTCTGRIEFDDNQIWEEKITIKTDIRTGIIRIYKDKQLYARMFKSNELS